MLLRRWIAFIFLGGAVPLILFLTLQPWHQHSVQSVLSDNRVLQSRGIIHSTEVTQTESQTALSDGENSNDPLLIRMKLLQKERQERLRAACPNVSIRTNPLGTTFNVNDLGVTYCCITMCASTAFKTFAEIVTDNTCPDLDAHFCAREKFPIVRSAQQFLSNSLIIVRNPWKRLVSAYTDKFVHEKIGFSKLCYDYHKKTQYGGPPVSFAEFVDCVLNDVALGRPLNPHVAPIHWHCMPCQANYTYIATVETLDLDFKYLRTAVFPKKYSTEAYDRVAGSLHRRRHERQSSTVLPYDRAYGSLRNTALSDLIKIYALDAAMFGYDAHPLKNSL